MRPHFSSCFYILAISVSSQFLVIPSDRNPATDQRPLLNMDPVGPGGPSIPNLKAPLDKLRNAFQSGSGSGSGSGDGKVNGGVMLSDVMGKDRSINIFAGFTRDVASITQRLDDSARNSTILAPLNSAIDKLPRKPWEDARDYDTLGTNAYEGDDGRDRAQSNLRRFVEAHVVTSSPWQEKDKVKTLLGDRDIWWEEKDGKKIIQPDNIEVDSVASRVGNGEVWIIRGVRNYA